MKKGENKGITLIALVITIIVLLILAGVTINALVGENGILRQASNSRLKTDIGREIEQIKVAALATYSTNGTIPYSAFREEMYKYNDVDYVDWAYYRDDTYTLVSKVEKPNNLSNLFMPVSYATDEEENADFAIVYYVSNRVYYIKLNKDGYGDPPGSIYADPYATENVNDPYDNGTDDNGTYDNGTYDNGTYDNGIYDNGTYDNYSNENYSNENYSNENGSGGETGEYVSTPTSVSALREGDQVIYTDQYGNEIPCTVLYDAYSRRSYADQNYGVQIIANNNVGSGVELGNGTGSASTDATAINTAKSSYNNAIGILNNAARAYLNTNIASDARCVGSVPNNKDSRSTTIYADTSDYWYDLYEGQFEEGDTNWTTDFDQMTSLRIISLPTSDYWVASRYAGSGVSVGTKHDTSFNVRYLLGTGSNNSTQGNPISKVLCGIDNYNSDATTLKSYSQTLGLRPVFTLRSDATYQYEDGVRVLVP